MIVELKKVRAQKRKRALNWREAQTSGIVPLPATVSTIPAA